MRNRTLAMLAAAGSLGLGAAPVGASAAPLSSIFNCAAPGSKQETGALVGAAAGALLGSQVSKNERALGAVVGAGLGAAAGSYIGCRMQSRDQAVRAQAAFETALDTGRSQTWTDPRTGASGRIDVLSTERADDVGAYGRPVSSSELRFAPGVRRISSGLTGAAPDYYAPKAVNLRAGPSTRDRVVGKLTAGEEFDVIGRTSDGWLLVERDGYVEGYVSQSVVQPAGRGPVTRVSAGDCRVVEQTIRTKTYGVQRERYRACRGDDRQWDVVKI